MTARYYLYSLFELSSTAPLGHMRLSNRGYSENTNRRPLFFWFPHFHCLNEEKSGVKMHEILPHIGCTFQQLWPETGCLFFTRSARTESSLTTVESKSSKLLFLWPFNRSWLSNESNRLSTVSPLCLALASELSYIFYVIFSTT